MKALALALLLIGAGCTSTQQGGFITTPPVLQVPLAQAALVYAYAKTAYTVLSLRVGDLCKAGKLSPADCATLSTQDALAKQLDAEIRQEILAAKGELDWQKIMQVLQILAGLAVKVGGL